MIDRPYVNAKVIAEGALTVGTAVSSLSPGSTAQSATLTIEDGSVRIGFTTSPTSTTGHKFDPGDVVYLRNKNDVTNFEVIRDSGSASATVNYSISDSGL